MLHRLGWALTGALALIAVLALAHALEAGPLDPPGPVGATMRTLDELSPSWDQKLTAISGTGDACHSQRFECVLPDAAYPDGAGVLDHETGLVWQRVPDTVTLAWDDAVLVCASASTGGRWGWRLPTIDELTSLLNSDGPGPFILDGTAMFFWSSTTTIPGDATMAFAGDFSGSGSVFTGNTAVKDSYWCVRGGGGARW